MNNDLIDRTALLRKWDKKFFAMGADRLGRNGDDIMWYLNSLIDEIKNAPTVNIIQHKDWYLVNKAGAKELLDREKPEGKWDKRHTELLKYFVKCEKCGEEIMTSHKNYCPNCGADMRGKEE